MNKPKPQAGGFPDDAELSRLAGAGAFARGRAYWREQRVSLGEQSADALAGEARGSHVYSLWLKREGLHWTWDCSCPAAEDGSLCKHLVAAVLTARDGDEPVQAITPVALRMQQLQSAEARLEQLLAMAEALPRPAAAPARGRRATTGRGVPDDLGAFLRAQPAEHLAAWLLDLAEKDSAIDKRLRLHQAGAQPEALKAALGKLLDPGGFLDYRASMRYAGRLDDVLAALQARLAEDPAHARELCEYALGRLFKIYERSDDSAGAIGQRMHEIAALHARACAAASPGAGWAGVFHTLQLKDGWGLLSIADYWDALGAEGQAAYGKRVLAEFERLPASKEGGDSHYDVRRRTEAYARAHRDFDLLQRVLRWDLSHAHGHQCVLESLREFGREREALDWAEAAIRKFPRDPALRTALAECLHAAGLNDEALEQHWQAFRLRPGSVTWDALKRAAGDAWPHWRARALDGLAKAEGAAPGLRIQLLQHDGDLAAAVVLARSHEVFPGVLVDLAREVQRGDPGSAGELMLRAVELQLPRADAARYSAVVGLLKQAVNLLPATQWQPFVADLRAKYAKRPKLMQLLRDAGL